MAPAARRFDYVLLDCDGTLLDTLSDLAAAGNHVCALHGWEPYSLEEYKRKVGNGQRVLASRIVPPELAGDEALVDEVYREFCAYYALHKEDHTAPYPGMVAALERMQAAGAVLGGLLIGFIEIVIVALFPALSGYRDAFAFVVLILVLLVKPTGLLGEKTTEKV